MMRGVRERTAIPDETLNEGRSGPPSRFTHIILLIIRIGDGLPRGLLGVEHALALVRSQLVALQECP